MKKAATIILISFLFIGCHKKIVAADLANLNGYWEIEKVIFPDGTKKEYTSNETFDYFDIKNNKGFRKKVTPQFDGTFLVTDAFENVTITQKGDKHFLNYSTSFSKWKEELLVVSDKELVTINDSKKEYHYKRAAPINLTGDGEKAQ